MIDRLHISNFRGISKPDLSGFKRGNLVVGANNAGKTSLLEALSLQGMLLNIHEFPALFRALPKAGSKKFENWVLAKGAEEGEVAVFSEGTSKSVWIGGNDSHQRGPVPDRLPSIGSLKLGWHPSHQEDGIGYTCHTISDFSILMTLDLHD